MAVRTDVLAHLESTQGLGNVVTLITVPAGEVWLVRQITIDNRTGSAATIILQSLRSTLAVKWSQDVVATSTPLRLTGQYLVAEAGDTLQCVSTVAGAVRFGFYGSRLVVS